MMSRNYKSYFILMYKWILIPITLLFTLFFLIYLYASLVDYEFNILNSDLLTVFLTFMAYFYLVSCIIILISFFKKYNELIRYVVLFTPIIPELFIFLRIYQSRDLFNEYSLNLLMILCILFMILYLLLFILTLSFVKYSSLNIIRSIVGKDLFEIQDDYSFISIFSKTYPEEGNIVKLIKNTISNFLKYKKENIEYIYIDGKKYTIYNYTKQDSIFTFHKKNIILIEFDVIISENHKQVEIFNRDNENKDTIHKCVYLYQFCDEGDKISNLPSTFQDVYLALKGILPKDSLIFYCKDDDITPPEICDLRYNLSKKYLLLTYGTLIDRTDIIIKDIMQRLKEPHKKVIKYIVIFISILIFIIYIYNSIHNYLFTLKFETLMTIGLLIPPATYYSIKIYDRLKNK